MMIINKNNLFAFSYTREWKTVGVNNAETSNYMCAEFPQTWLTSVQYSFVTFHLHRGSSTANLYVIDGTTANLCAALQTVEND